MILRRTTVLAGAALGVCLGISGEAAGSIAPFTEAYQVPVSQSATFLVRGPAIAGDLQADAFLRKVTYPTGEEYTEFYRPSEVRSLHVAPADVTNFGIRGGDRITQGVPGRRTLGGFAGGTPTAADLVAFGHEIKEVMANRNLNNYVDMTGTPDFSFVLGFDRPVRDDDPAASDAHGEILYFERGATGGNSWITMQAVDVAGNALGPALAISPRETFLTTPQFSIHQPGQRMGGLAIDVSRLGVPAVQYLKLTRTSAAHPGYEVLMTAAVDFKPDFKIQAVITHPNDLPGISYD